MISKDVLKLKNNIVLAEQKCNEVSNSVKSLISFFNNLTELQCNYVPIYTSRITQNMERLKLQLNTVYKTTSVYLTDFLSSLNDSINDINEEFITVSQMIETIDSTAKELYQLVLYDIEIEGFLEYDLSLSDIIQHEKDFAEFNNSISVLLKELEKANTKLIVKE